MESAGGVLLPVAKYGKLRPLVDQGGGTFKGMSRELTLDHVAHVPSLEQYNALSTKRLTTNFDAPIRVFQAAVIIRPRRGGKPLVLRPLIKIKVRRSVTSKKAPVNPAAATYVVAARPHSRDVMDFQRLLCYPSEEITRRMARMTGVLLRGT